MIKLPKAENLQSWVKIPIDSDFSIHNIPFGIGKLNDGSVLLLSRIGDMVINLKALNSAGYFDDHQSQLNRAFESSTLNEFISLGKVVTSSVRARIQHLLDDENNDISNREEFSRQFLIPVASVSMIMPVKVTDYTDFYSSIEHASNVGSMFRDPSNPLLPNWRHLPVGYHGRTSSIVISGTNIHRPKGQIMESGSDIPVLSETKMLDFELELAFVVGQSTELGTSIAVNKAEDYIFGFLLFNDLSARDIQSWEYVPLGPFLSKNFGSIVSPWIVTLDALEPFRIQGPSQDPKVLPYLRSEGLNNFDINLEVSIKADGTDESLVTRSNFRYMYWNICQQLAHHTINGCNINVGDLYASGTISGPDPGSMGSMLELTWRGKNPITLADGSRRAFIEDNDTIIIRGYSKRGNVRVGFGECTTTIIPSKVN